MKRKIKEVEELKKDALELSEMENVKGGGICLCNHRFACQKFRPKPPEIPDDYS